MSALFAALTDGRVAVVRGQMAGYENISKTVSKIDTRKADAYHDRDRVTIKAAVRASDGGFVAVNGRVHAALRRWHVEQAQALVDRRVAAAGSELHPDALAAMMQLGKLLNAAGEWCEAEKLYRRVWHGFETFGDAHREETLAAINHLANALTPQGNYEEAARLYSQARQGRKLLLRGGEDHPDTMASANNLANALFYMGKTREAEELYRATLTRRKAVLTEEHVDTLATLNNLANLLIRKREWAEAEPMLRAALRGREKELGEMHEDTLSTVNNLGNLLKARGGACAKEAEKMYKRALKGRRETLGEKHPKTLATHRNLSRLYDMLGRHAEAEKHRHAAGRCASRHAGVARPAGAGDGHAAPP